MTNEQEKAKELAELLIAFAEGKQLEITSGGEWYTYSLNVMDSFIKDFYNTMYKFRIKPETRRVALNQQDLIDRELSGKTMRVGYGHGHCVITDYNRSLVFLADDELTYETFSLLAWLDGTSCSKEVECE